VSGALDRTRLLAARYRAAQDRPYLATALFSITVVESAHVATMGVDRRWRCYVSPAFVARTPVPQLAAVWIHEVAHLLRDHHGRADRLPPGTAHGHLRINIAQDCEINDDLLADRLPLPAGRVEPDTYGMPDGLFFERYLTLLPPEVGGDLDCGSGAHGVDRSWEHGGGQGMGEGIGQGIGEGIGAAEAEAIRHDTARQIRARGTAPGGWQRWALQTLEPQVDWRRQLGGAVREALAWAGGAVDYAYQRPSRRSAALRGVILPSLRRPVPRVAIVVDTSGSMGEPELAAALAEVAGVLRVVGVGGNRTTVLSCDAAVHVAQAVYSVGEVQLTGGGGTDLRVGVAEALKHRPHVVIVLTDGFTPWPGAPLESTRLIAALIGPAAPEPPAWITTVRVAPSLQ